MPFRVVLPVVLNGPDPVSCMLGCLTMLVPRDEGEKQGIARERNGLLFPTRAK